MKRSGLITAASCHGWSHHPPAAGDRHTWRAPARLERPAQNGISSADPDRKWACQKARPCPVLADYGPVRAPVKPPPGHPPRALTHPRPGRSHPTRPISPSHAIGRARHPSATPPGGKQAKSSSRRRGGRRRRRRRRPGQHRNTAIGFSSFPQRTRPRALGCGQRLEDTHRMALLSPDRTVQSWSQHSTAVHNLWIKL